MCLYPTGLRSELMDYSYGLYVNSLCLVGYVCRTLAWSHGDPPPKNMLCG